MAIEVTLRHVELLQEMPQTLPQPPQLALSLVSSTHELAHFMKPVLHVNPQFVPSHVSVAFAGGEGQGLVHEVPHVLSDVLLEQVPLQLCVPFGQVQLLLWQIMVLPHAWPQLPQLELSFDSLAHPPLQGLKGELQLNPQLVPSHVAVAFAGGVQGWQELGPMPQVLTEVLLAQVPPQPWVPPGQTQALLWQIIPPPQTWPQVAQFCGSLVKSTQPLLQGLG
jgi:hypothetical protein